MDCHISDSAMGDMLNNKTSINILRIFMHLEAIYLTVMKQKYQ